jgi:hypothetical protein
MSTNIHQEFKFRISIFTSLAFWALLIKVHGYSSNHMSSTFQLLNTAMLFCRSLSETSGNTSCKKEWNGIQYRRLHLSLNSRRWKTDLRLSRSLTAVNSPVIRDSPYYVFVALCIVVIVVSLIFKIAYFLFWPVQELLKKARVRCAIANNKIFGKTFNIFIRGRYLYQWYHYNHNAKRYENVNKGNRQLTNSHVKL